MTPLAQAIRNAYEARDREALERVMQRVSFLELAAMPENAPAKPKIGYCVEGEDCTCTSLTQSTVCKHRRQV